jgi:hypothetical protein
MVENLRFNILFFSQTSLNKKKDKFSAIGSHDKKMNENAQADLPGVGILQNVCKIHILMSCT